MLQVLCVIKDLVGICSIFREIGYLKSRLKIFNILFTKTKITENLSFVILNIYAKFLS